VQQILFKEKKYNNSIDELRTISMGMTNISDTGNTFFVPPKFIFNLTQQ